MSRQESAPVFISSKVAAEVLHSSETIAAIQSAYRIETPDAAAPPRTVATGEKAWLRTLPAIPTGCRYFGQWGCEEVARIEGEMRAQQHALGEDGICARF